MKMPVIRMDTSMTSNIHKNASLGLGESDYTPVGTGKVGKCR
jgi:hypothetical protein